MARHHTLYLSRTYDHQGSPTKPSYPRAIAGLTITGIRDLTIGYDSTNPPTYKPALPLSSGQMIQFRAESLTDGTKITLTTRCARGGPGAVTALTLSPRTSGTEPKVRNC